VNVSDRAGKIDRLDGQGVGYSVGLVGWKWAHEEGDTSARYKSARVPFARASSYTDMELAEQIYTSID
jgi:hypothetical protein